MMKQYIFTLLFTLAGLAGMAQTNQPLPNGAVQFSNQLWIVPSDSTIWTGDVFEGKYVNLGSWHKVDSLLALKADASDLDDFYTQSQIDAFLALKADESALDDFYTKLEVDGLLGGYVPTSRTVNGKALTGNITLNANDVGALQAGDDVSDLVNDAGYITAGDIPADAVTSVNGMTGAVTVSKADVGLGNVDNTSDLNKPISTATQAALDGKEDKSNKVTSLSTPNNTTYPTTQAVKTAIDAIEPPDVTGSNGIQVNSGEVSPVYGTSAGTVAQGNDSRINNGQTAYGWGDWKTAGWGSGLTTGSAISTDILEVNVSGVYRVVGTASNLPTPSNGYALVYYRANNNRVVDYVSDAGRRFYNVKSTTWSGWKEYGNFNPADYIPASQKAAANGVASLDGSGKVPTSQLPTTGMQYQGAWNASTNTPTLADGTGTEGYFYRVTTAGTQNLGSGSITFSVGDDVIHNGSVWQRAPSGTTSTNLALGTRTSTTMPITNSNGTGVTLPVATTSLAGLMSGADKTKLDAALVSYTETDPTVASHVKSITTGDIANWNAAYGGYNSVISNWFGGGSMSYKFVGSASGSPESGLTYGGWWANFIGSNYSAGFAARNNKAFFKTIENGVDQGWKQIWHEGNFTPADYLPSSSFTWSNLDGKPSAFPPAAHTHSANDITSDVLALDRIPAITTAKITDNNVTLGKLQQIPNNYLLGNVSGTTGNVGGLTAAQVRAMLNVANGATANSSDATLLNRANHTGTQAIGTVSGLQSALDAKATSGTGSSQVRNNGQLDARYLQSGDLPTVNNGTLSLSTGTGLTGSASFTANQAGNSSFTVAAASGYAIPTTSQISTWNNAVPNTRQINGKALSANVTLTNADIGSEPAFTKNTAFNKNFGTAAGTVAQGNDSRIVNAAQRNATNTFSGANTFSQPITVANATASNHAVTLSQMNAAVRDNVIIVDSLFFDFTDDVLPAQTHLTKSYAVTGVIPDDVVVVNNVSPVGVILTARVSAAGTIQITAHNPYTTNLASAPFPLKIRILKYN